MVWAEQGYVVVLPNISGSTTFGIEHAASESSKIQSSLHECANPIFAKEFTAAGVGIRTRILSAAWNI